MVYPCNEEYVKILDPNRKTFKKKHLMFYNVICYHSGIDEIIIDLL